MDERLIEFFADIEWTSLHSLLSHAHQTLSGGGGGGGVSGVGSSVIGSVSSSVTGVSHSNVQLVRNELIHTDIRTGLSVSLRSNRSEEPPIDMIRVSHLKQYFIVAFQGAPFELWDLRNMTLLRTMPKKFPPITALDWSPLHNLKSLKKKMTEEQEKEKEQGKTGDFFVLLSNWLFSRIHVIFFFRRGK